MRTLMKLTKLSVLITTIVAILFTAAFTIVGKTITRFLILCVEETFVQIIEMIVIYRQNALKDKAMHKMEDLKRKLIEDGIRDTLQSKTHNDSAELKKEEPKNDSLLETINSKEDGPTLIVKDKPIS